MRTTFRGRCTLGGRSCGSAEAEVEPVIKELSNCLLQTRMPRSELDTCVSKFETALQRARSAHQVLKTTLERLRNIGEHFPEQ